MPARPEGVYRDGSGSWYVKVSVGRDPLTGRRTQVTRRGFKTAAEASRACHDLLAQVDRGQFRPAAGGLTVNELLDLYLDGLDADGRLSAETRFDYRHSANDYVRPPLGARLRIGELVALRWPSVDLHKQVVRVVDFVSTLGHETVPLRPADPLGVQRWEERTVAVAVLCDGPQEAPAPRAALRLVVRMSGAGGGLCGRPRLGHPFRSTDAGRRTPDAGRRTPDAGRP